MIKWLFGYIFTCLLLQYSLAGVEIVKKQKDGIIFYNLKTNNTEYRLFYLPKNKDNPKIMDKLNKNIFSDMPVDYKIVYNDYSGNYEVYINKDLLFSFDKQTAYQLGYSDLKQLVNSYRITLSNLAYIPEIFFEKTHIELTVNQLQKIRVYNKTGKDFILSIPDYCSYKDGFLYIKHENPVYQQTLSISYEGGQDISFLTIKIPTFYVKSNKIYLSQYPSKLNKVDIFQSFILPNIIINTDIEIKYYSRGNKYIIYSEGARFPYKDIKEVIDIVFLKQYVRNEIDFDYLVISNNPEKITHKGIIFESNVLGENGYFVWFHHLFKDNLNYCIEVQNGEEVESEVEFFVELSKSQNEVESGIKASLEFFDFVKNKNMSRLLLNPGQKARLVIEKMYPNQVITGFVYLKASNDLKIKIFSFDKVVPDNILDKDGTPRSTGKYPKPIIHKQISFDTSKNFMSFKIPDNEIISNKIDQNYSNYCVMYKLFFTIHNSKQQPERVNIYFSSISGYTPLVFMYNDNIYRAESGLYRKIFSLELDAGQTVEIPITILITPGLSYPVEFEISTNKL
ncbi:MAG: hypothetical protein ABDH21_05885 [bacterium]